MDPKRWAAVIGANVAAIRKAADMTQARLAAATGSTVPAVSRLESGEHLPSLATLLKVAEALGVSPCKLIEEPPAPGRPKKKGG